MSFKWTMLIALLIPACALAGTERQSVDLSLSWSVGLEADGTIASLTPLNKDYQPVLQQRLEPAIRSWRFTAGKVNGTAAPTQTTLNVRVVLEPLESGDYVVRLRKASTGPTYAHVTLPEYPDSALKFHREGAVLVDIDYDADGRVTAANAMQGGEPKAAADFQRAAVAAVKHWTLKPETIAGHGMAGKARIPVCFSFSRRTGDPSADHCRWKIAGDEEPLDTDHPLALSSVVHLETDIAGRTL